MATYNMSAYLSDAIQSVLDQEFQNFELLIGDNLSTDDTSKIARQFALKDSRVKYHLNEKHLTAAENFNACLDRSDNRSKYWIMLASDDWWKPELLRTLVGIAEQDQALTFIHCDARLTDADGTPSETKYSDLWNYMRIPGHGPHYGVEPLFYGCYVMALATLVNRANKEFVYPQHPLMDPSLRLAPDHNLWLQLMVRGAKAFYYDESLAYYRKHKDAMTMPWNDRQRLHEEIRIFGEKLQGVCSPELEPLRLKALRNRYAQLGFDYLSINEPEQAADLLREAARIGGERRLDIFCARVLSALPVSANVRAGLWQQAVRANGTLGRSR
jgi:glycosyltransferase EpsE